MSYNGKNVLDETVQKPLYLLDENISYKFAIPFKALGYDITSVHDEFPKDQLILQGKKSAEDPDIIEWIGKQQSDYRLAGIWITDDWEASKLHAKLILAHSICVFWICDPLNKALRAIQQLQVLAMLLEEADQIFKTASSPIYLRGTIDNRKTRLWTLNCHLMSKKLEWKKVVI
jgi:hypothetical protein